MDQIDAFVDSLIIFLIFIINKARVVVTPSQISTVTVSVTPPSIPCFQPHVLGHCPVSAGVPSDPSRQNPGVGAGAVIHEVRDVSEPLVVIPAVVDMQESEVGQVGREGARVVLSAKSSERTNWSPVSWCLAEASGSALAETVTKRMER